MLRQISQYRIFIGSPGGLRDEREAFRRVLTTFNEHHGEPNGIVFAPVGWEDTLGGVGGLTRTISAVPAALWRTQ
jgi:hypothetical protein